MPARRTILLKILGVAHVVVAIMLLPANLFLGFFTFTIVLPGQIWLISLGIRLWRPDARTKAALLVTHLILAPFAILLIVYGLYAVSTIPPGKSGEGVLGSFGVIPITLGVCSGILALWSLYIAKNVRIEWPEGAVESFSREKLEQLSSGIAERKELPGYVDVFVSTITDQNKESYLPQARTTGKVFKEHGALSVIECWGEDVDSFSLGMKRREGENLVLSWIIWPSKHVRDAGLEKIAADPRLRSENLPHSIVKQRMIKGGFQVILEA